MTKDYVSFRNSFAATSLSGDLIFFTVLVPVTASDADTEKAAKKVAKENKLRKVRDYASALVFG